MKDFWKVGVFEFDKMGIYQISRNTTFLGFALYGNFTWMKAYVKYISNNCWLFANLVCIVNKSWASCCPAQSSIWKTSSTSILKYFDIRNINSADGVLSPRSILPTVLVVFCQQEFLKIRRKIPCFQKRNSLLSEGHYWLFKVSLRGLMALPWEPARDQSLDPALDRRQERQKSFNTLG